MHGRASCIEGTNVEGRVEEEERGEKKEEVKREEKEEKEEKERNV